ncbi:MAG: TonB-dependent receptor [Lewinellaceae bacterium]|nr:TonB-dependent receptor [Lewinellaceae bacterium]
MHLSAPVGRNGELSAFALFGNSKNVFEHKTDSSEIKAFKDLFDISFDSYTHIAGLSWRQRIGSKTSMRVATVASGQVNKRTSQPFGTELGVYQYDRSDEDVQSHVLTISHLPARRLRLEGGASYVSRDYQYTIDRGIATAAGLYQTESVQPWASAKWTTPNERTTFSAGLHGLWWLQHGFRAEPRFSVTQRFGSRHALSASWGLFSQTPSWWQGEVLLVAEHYGLRYTWQLSPTWTLRSELFSQYIDNAPVIPYQDAYISVLSESEAVIPNVFEVAQGSDGQNYGIELGAERLLMNGWFLLANATILKAQTALNGLDWEDSRWDIGRVVNLTLGREWQRMDGAPKAKFFGISGRAVWSGGFRAMPVDAVASADAATTVYSAANGFSIQQPDFFRLDLRVYWKRSLGDRRNSTFAMDFQNATMQKNTAYRYFDPFTKSAETKYQLGLIPNISWRLEF